MSDSYNLKKSDDLNWFKISLLALLVVFIFYRFGSIFTPFLISFGLAYLLDPIADKIEKFKINRTVGIFLLVICAITFLTLISILFFSVTKVQLEILIKSTPDYIETAKKWVLPFIDNFTKENSKAVKNLIEEFLNGFGQIPIEFISFVSNYLLSGISGFAGFIATVLSFLIIPIATFYMLRDFDKFFSKAKNYIPDDRKDLVINVFSEIDNVLRVFFKGQLLVCLIMASFYSFGLYFCSTPLWLLIGIISGLGNMVPFLGLMIGIIPAVCLTYFEFHDVKHVLYVVAVYVIVQFLEGTFITPKIIGDKLGLHPLFIIIAVFFGGAAFGFFGILLAVPVAAILNVCFKRLVLTN